VFDRNTQHVAAVLRAPGNLDLFVIGNDSHVWTTAWSSATNNWNTDWRPLPGQAVFDRNTQHVAAVSRAPGNLDLFVIGNDGSIGSSNGHVWTTFWGLHAANPAISLDPIRNDGGRFIEVAGTGFTPNQGVKVGYHLDNPSGGVGEGHPDTFTSDQTGGFIHLIPLESEVVLRWRRPTSLRI
jgi:hypothetical protein